MKNKTRIGRKSYTAFLLACSLLACSIPVSAAEGDGGKPGIAIENLRTDYLENPIGIEADSVSFSWNLESNVIGAAQTAYQIRVYEKGEESRLVWDSKKVKSSRSVGIPYEGSALKEATAYRWTVQAWNEEGKEIPAREAEFETGVTHLPEWTQTEFIRMNAGSSAPIFRTERKLSGEVGSARLYITALGVYEAYINGSRVGTVKEDGKIEYHHMNPGYGNKNISLGYQTYDVTDWLKDSDRAALSIAAGTGWYYGMAAVSSQPAVKAMLKIVYTNGQEETVRTNTEEWRGTLDGPVTANGVYYGEDYDAGLAEELGDFTQAGYDDSGWAGSGASAEQALPVIQNELSAQSARYVKLTVNRTGPATTGDNENRLQIMELQLLDAAGTNVAAGIVPEVTHDFTHTNWNRSFMTDGDDGSSSDRGWSSAILGTEGRTSLDISDDPVVITLDLGQEKNFQTLRMYPRTQIAAVSGTECVNYPKEYKVEVSADGVQWHPAGTYQVGRLTNTVRYGDMKISAASYAGEIRAQAGIPGKILDQYSKDPVSATIYSGQKASSAYAGGEINVESYYAYERPEDELYLGAYHEVSPEREILENGIALHRGQTMIIDMGQNMTAVPELVFSAGEGTELTMNFAEILNDGSESGTGAKQADGPRGSLYQKSLRGARSAVRYTFAGKGKETYQPSMSFFGYQYIGLTATGDVTVYSARSKALSSVSEQTGEIETNNENVNKLFSNTLYGQMSNYFTTATDCPQRDERLFWTGDTQAFAQTAVYNFDSLAFLNDLQEIMSENTMIQGYVSSVADDMGGFFGNCAAGWSDVEVVLPWTLYMQTGDVSILERNWEAMQKYMTYLESTERGADQAPLSGDRNFGEWLSFQGTSTAVIADYYYGYDAYLMSRAAKALGRTEEAGKYSEKFEAIRTQFLKTHVTFTDGKLTIKSGDTSASRYQFQYNMGKSGVWEDNSQAALLWMLKLGFYDGDEMKEAAEKLLVDNIRNVNQPAGSVRNLYGANTLSVGFLGSNVITPVLSDLGYGDVSYDLLLQDGQPSWLFEVKAGSTTVWERWDSYTPGVGFGDSEMNSFNHYAYGSVLEWMYRYMAGISADESDPGFRHIILQPTMDTGKAYNGEARIRSVAGSYQSYCGKIESSWKSDGDGNLTQYQVRIPANTTAVLYLPVDGNAIQGFKPVKGVSEAKMSAHNGRDTVEIALESGGYEFTVQDGKLEVSHGEGYVPEYVSTDVDEWFTDVDPVDMVSKWPVPEIQDVFDRGLMKGMSEHVFGVGAPMARSHLALTLWRAEGTDGAGPEPEGEVISFRDVQEMDAETKAAVAWASSVGIIGGYKDEKGNPTGYFGPSDHITREQLALMMVRYAQYKGYGEENAEAPEEALNGFTDLDQINRNDNGEARKALAWAVSNGIVQGEGGTTRINPRGQVLREVCATFLSRFEKNVAEKE